MGEEVVFMTTLVIGAIVVLSQRIQTLHKQRMEMIIRGISPADMANGVNRNQAQIGALKWGLLMLCGGIGFLVGIMIHISLHPVSDENPSFVLACTIISGGIGLLIFYRMISSRE